MHSKFPFRFKFRTPPRVSLFIVSTRRMASPTYLTGTYSAARGQAKLRRIINKTHQLLQKIPKDAAYKKNTEIILCHRLHLLNEAGNDIKKIEGSLGGKMEMLISQAELELDLVRRMLLWKPWERLVEMPPPGQWDWPPGPA